MFGGSLSQLRKYDVLATFPETGVQVTYECKRDRLAYRTQNVAVEHKAILHSESEFVVYLIDGDPHLHVIGRETLLGLLKENWSGERKWPVVRGGEFQDYMTLIPVREFVEVSLVI